MADHGRLLRTGFDPGPWGSGGFLEAHARRYRMWHVCVPAGGDPAGGGHLLTRGDRLIDVAWGLIICDRVSPRGTTHILDHVPQIRVATY